MILKFDGKDVTTMRGLPRLVAQTPIGKDVDVELLRKGQRAHAAAWPSAASPRRTAGQGSGQGRSQGQGPRARSKEPEKSGSAPPSRAASR